MDLVQDLINRFDDNGIFSEINFNDPEELEHFNELVANSDNYAREHLTAVRELVYEAVEYKSTAIAQQALDCYYQMVTFFMSVAILLNEKIQGDNSHSYS